MFKCTGKLLYYPTWWLILKVDEDVCRYYRKLIHFYNRSLRLNPSKNDGHITILAGKYEKPVNKMLWGKYEGDKIEFSYNTEIKNDDEYYWMAVQCKRIEEIRLELGLNPTIKWPWHLTIGNLK